MRRENCFTFASWLSLCLMALLAVGSVQADENEVKDVTDASAEEEKAITVKTEELTATVAVDGVFVGVNAQEVILDPQAWSTLKVEKVVPHGASVMEGDPVLTLETEDLVEAIAEAEKDLESTTLSLKLATDELRFMKESTAMDLEAAERNAQQAKDDLDYYLEVEEKQDLKMAKLNLQLAEYRLEYAQEELDQLTQMYEADDLTEQTEEIILKRAQRDVTTAEMSLERSKLNYARQLETLFPREKESKINSESRSALSKAKSVATLPLMLKQKEMSVEQMQKSLADKKEKLQEMKQDLELMTVYASMSGIVYYGQSTFGKWSEVSAREKQLKEGGTVPAKTVLMTIVDPETLAVMVTFSEEQLGKVKDGNLSVVRPAALTSQKLSGKLTAVSPVALSDGKYHGAVRLADAEVSEMVTPGMTAKVKILVKKVEDAIMLPESAVHQDDFSADGAYVWLAGEEPTKQPVTLGLKQNSKVEITSGLEAGDEVLKKAP